MSERVFVELLTLNSMRVNVTFTMADGSELLQSGLGRALGTTFANVSNAPVKLPSFVISSFVSDQRVLQEKISQFYTRHMRRSIANVLGSADTFGAPAALMNDVGEGFVSFFEEPAKGLIMGPEAFARGLGRGTASLARLSVGGASTSVAALTGTLSKGLNALIGGEEYGIDAAAHSRRQTNTLVGGLSAGFSDVRHGIASAGKGLWKAPIEGARKGGAKGFIVGAARGVSGVVIRPAVRTTRFSVLFCVATDILPLFLYSLPLYFRWGWRTW